MLKLTLKFCSLNLYLSLNQPHRQAGTRKLYKKLGFPEKPRKPKNSFLLFKDDVKNEITKVNSNCKEKDIISIAAAKWKELSPEKKILYDEAALKNMVVYKEKLLAYEQSLTEDLKTSMKEAEENLIIFEDEKIKKLNRIKKLEEFNRPKKPNSPFLRYIIDISKTENTSIREIAKREKGTWPSVPNEIKQKYKNDYAVEREEYIKKLEEWEQKMIKLGHHDLVRAKTAKKCYKDLDQL